MTDVELLFTSLAELTTHLIAEATSANGIAENAQAGKNGGAIAKNARKELESKTNKRVITSDNFLVEKKKKLK